MSAAQVQADEGLRRAGRNDAGTGRWLEKVAVLRERDWSALTALTAAHPALTNDPRRKVGWSS
ncbi:hypothetical protein ACWCYY_10870 [Kitasatospora sp. NPDC001664]